MVFSSIRGLLLSNVCLSGLSEVVCSGMVLGKQKLFDLSEACTLGNMRSLLCVVSHSEFLNCVEIVHEDS